jgi:hypothetical protein
MRAMKMDDRAASPHGGSDGQTVRKVALQFPQDVAVESTV